MSGQPPSYQQTENEITSEMTTNYDGDEMDNNDRTGHKLWTAENDMFEMSSS